MLSVGFIKKEKNGNRPLTISFPYDDDEQPWSRTIEVKENFTLAKLDKYIQAIVGFDDDHLYEFFIGKNGLS